MMKKELKDYLHLYLGCECEVVYANEIKRGRLIEILENSIRIEGSSGYWGPNFAKPILRPLSDMSPDELQECGNMVYDFSDDPELNNHQWQDFEIGLAPEQFLWLISKHFDLFGLIDAGLAIDKTKTLTPCHTS